MSTSVTDSTPAVIVTPRSGNPVLGVVVQEMTPWAQIAVRALRTYIQSLLGFLAVAVAPKPVLESIGVVIPADEFWKVFLTAAGVAVAPTVMTLLWNAAELLGKIDARFPKVRA